MSAEVANQTNIIFQNATLGGKELNPAVLTQLKKTKIMFADLTVLNQTQVSIELERPEVYH